MLHQIHPPTVDEELHAAEVESLERRIMDLALSRTGSKNGAIFLWDERERGLRIDFHVVDGVVVNIPDVVLRHRKDGRPDGIALWVHAHNRPHLCRDATKDPHYARYFQDVRSIAAAPIPYQGRSIGVITVSAREAEVFTRAHLDELESLAASSAKFLRRAQLYRARHREGARPFLIKGLSPDWLEVERRLERVSMTDAPVLIHGESGTGKELVANAIHFNSPRAGKAFVCVNCAAIPETLLESTLFGHERGAFTGATSARVGEFQKADGGTLFLDEVGELALPLQAKVLRAVEHGEIQPIGSNAPAKRVNVRLLCATNRDLVRMVREVRFRDDLYHRLSVVALELPPLRTYKNNLEVLAQAFLQQANRQHGRDVERIAPGAMAILKAYDYPGNVRELRNIIEHAVIMAGTKEIRPEDLPPSVRPLPRRTPAPASGLPKLEELRESCLEPVERQYLVSLLKECGGSVREAARRAGVNVVTLYRLLKKRGLSLRREVETVL